MRRAPTPFHVQPSRSSPALSDVLGTLGDMSTDRDGTLPYRRAPLGTNALKRLGEAIASGGELTADHRDLYEAFIRDADQRRAIVQSAVSSLLAGAADQLPRASVAATGRTKTLKTLREKLIR